MKGFRTRCNQLSAVLLAALVLSGCSKMSGDWFSKETKSTNQTERAILVEVAPLQRGPIQEVLTGSTHLEAEKEVKVFARSSNLVTELLVEEGDRVLKDDLLARLEDDLQRIQLSKAQAELEKAQRDFARQKALYDQNLISDQDFSEVDFQLKQRQLSVEDSQRQLDYTEIRAPITGTITRRLIKLGDHVTPNQHLFNLIDFDSIVARIYVPEKDLPKLRLQQPARVRVTALPEQVFHGFVDKISPVVDAQTGTVKVTIAFQDPQHLRPGMYVNVAVITETQDDVVLIPKRALHLDGSQMFVYRLKPDRRVERILIKPQLMNADHVLPSSSLFAEGDQIVVSGQTGLKDEALVRLPSDPDPDQKDKEKNKDKESS